MKKDHKLQLIALAIPIIIFLFFIPECLYRLYLYDFLFLWVKDSIIAKACEYSTLRSLFTSMLLLYWVFILLKLNNKTFVYWLTGILSIIWGIITIFTLAGNQILLHMLALNRFEFNYLFGCCLFTIFYLLFQQWKANSQKKVSVTQRSLKLWACALPIISVLTMIPSFLAHYHLYNPIRIIDPMIVPSIERIVSYRSILTACLVLGCFLLMRNIKSKGFVCCWAGIFILGTILLYLLWLKARIPLLRSIMSFNLYEINFWCGSSFFYLIYLYLPHKSDKHYLNQT